MAGKTVRSVAPVESVPALARTEVVGKAIRSRLESELISALKRRSASEPRLAGAVRAVGLISPQLRSSMADAALVMVRRRSFGRELYTACLRTLADACDARAPAIVTCALGTDDAGGTPTLGAACLLRDPSLAQILSKIAASRQSHTAFAAETARVARGESNGAQLLAIAPMIKEAHRIALCAELFVPLARGAPVPLAIAPALAVFRQAERHLGRWLVLGEIAVKAGDFGPLREADVRASHGPSSARAAWALVLWALECTVARQRGTPPPPIPTERPTVELVAQIGRAHV